MRDEKLRKLWEKAAKDLSFDLDFETVIKIDQNNINYEFIVKNFGDDNGMIIFTSFDKVKPWAIQLSELGFGISVISSPASNSSNPYDKQSFIDMLSDWGWSRSDQVPPIWYKVRDDK